MGKERLDVLLVKRNLAESREKAKTYINTGIVEFSSSFRFCILGQLSDIFCIRSEKY